MTKKCNIIIDGSYFIYYNLFSAFSAFRKKYNIEITDAEYDPTLNPDFVDIYAEKLHQRLLYIKMNVERVIGVGALNDSPYLFSTDCSHRSNWRNAEYPEYKIGRRTGPPPPFNIKKTFNYGLNTILMKDAFKKRFNLVFLTSDHGEGDDIIAILTKHSTASENVVIANDRDFLQITDRAHIITLPGKELDIASFAKGEDLSTEDFILLKILVGDGADSLSNVFPNKGLTRCLKLLKDRTALQELLETVDGAQERFKRNSKLMDFKYIPEEVEREILTKYLGALKEYRNELGDVDEL